MAPEKLPQKRCPDGTRDTTRFAQREPRFSGHHACRAGGGHIHRLPFALQQGRRDPAHVNVGVVYVRAAVTQVNAGISDWPQPPVMQYQLVISISATGNARVESPRLSFYHVFVG